MFGSACGLMSVFCLPTGVGCMYKFIDLHPFLYLSMYIHMRIRYIYIHGTNLFWCIARIQNTRIPRNASRIVACLIVLKDFAPLFCLLLCNCVPGFRMFGSACGLMSVFCLPTGVGFMYIRRPTSILISIYIYIYTYADYIYIYMEQNYFGV